MGSTLSLYASAPQIPPLDDPKDDEPCSLLVEGVCESWSQPRFARFLTKSNIPYSKTKKVRGESFAVIDFASNKDRRAAYYFLEGCQLSHNVFSLRPFRGYDPPPMPYATQAEIIKCSSLTTQPLIERLYPLYSLSDQEQLDYKVQNSRQFLKDILPQDINLKINSTSEDDLLHYYVELAVGYDNEGNTRVGFNTSSRTNVTVQQIDESLLFPSEICNIASTFTDFVSSSPFPPYDNNSDTGKWRNALIRVSTTGEIMLIIATFGGLPLSEINRLVDNFKYDSNVKSFYWIKAERTNYDVTSPNRVLQGSPFITEHIGDLKFSIQPFTPFPFNISSYQKMLNKIVEKAHLSKKTVFVDISCGIGVACLMFSNKVKRTVGIDQSIHSINGANKNTEMNEIKNAFFVNATAEQILFDLANNLSGEENLVCFYDSMIPGPPVTNMTSVRNCQLVKTFIYVSDSPYTFAYDAQRILMDEKAHNTTPFKLDDVELFDFEPCSNSVRIVGIYTRK